MKTILSFLRARWRPMVLIVLLLAVLFGILSYRLGTVPHGLTAGEYAVKPFGLHSLWQQPFYLPLQLLRWASFKLSGHEGQIITRLPNLLLGAATIIAYGWLMRLWHGPRTALLGGVLFALSAWTLHVSRLASMDSMYFLAIPTLLWLQALLHRQEQSLGAVYVDVLILGALLYVPGLVWLVLLSLGWQAHNLKRAWQNLGSWWQKALLIAAGLMWLPLLVWRLRHISTLLYWLGLPVQMPTGTRLLHNFTGGLLHLFVSGPGAPQLWLGRLPILDAFALACCLLGIYFYARHWRATRSHVILSYFLLGLVLLTLGGAVPLSLLVPLLYVLAASGIAYMLHEWLRIFPFNPVARGFGILLVAAAVCCSGAYNLRAYFVAWPANTDTLQTFRYHR